jgi:ABC-type multidrug transport system ATPase subunit
MPIVQTESLTKLRGRFKLGPLDLKVEPGEILGIMGPSGAGKTLLLKILWGFVRPDSGTVHVFGLTPHLHQISVRLRAGYLSQSSGLYEWMTARQFPELRIPVL